MKEKLLDYLRCIKCACGKLYVSDMSRFENKDNILAAKLKCNMCGKVFPVEAGIPRFVSGNNYADSFGLQWNLNKRIQLDSCSGLSISKNRLRQVTGWPEKMEGVMVLEAGSGAGRFTEILLKNGATVFSFDISSAVDANYANNELHQNLFLFQADIHNIPLQKHIFDKVLCLGVLQHTPDPEKAFRSLAEFVRPGGELVIDVYARRLTSMLSWKYALRPLTKRIPKELLYKIVNRVVPVLLPVSIFLRRIYGKFGARLIPIAEYSHLGLPCTLNKEWAILDTFDMLSPEYDYPQTVRTVESWFKELGCADISVKYGPNGIVGKGRYFP